MTLLPGDLVIRSVSPRLDTPPRVHLEPVPDNMTRKHVIEFKRDEPALVIAVSWVQLAEQFGGEYSLLLYKHRIGWCLSGECELLSDDPATRRDD